MKRFYFFLIVLLGILFSSEDSLSQKIDLTIKFNTITTEYEVYGRPDFSGLFNVGGGTQVTVVLPNSIADVALVITSVNGGTWGDNSKVYAPTAAPNSDFHAVSTTGAAVSLTSGQETLFFKFTLGGNCVSGVRLFNNGSDPDSQAAGMADGDFNNFVGDGLTITDVYRINYNNTGVGCNNCPTLTNITTDNINPSTCGSSTGSIKVCGLTPNGSGYTVNYSKNGLAATALTNQIADASGCLTITGLSSGSYTNIIVSNASCTGTNALSATLSDPTAPSAPTSFAGLPTNACVGETVQLSATGIIGASYTWTVSPVGATLNSTIGTVSGTTASNTLSSSAAGTYTVSLTQTVSGCSSAPATTTINVTAIPSVASAVSASPSSICAGASSTLSGTCSVGTLSWYSDAGLTTALASNIVSPSATTTYYGACVSGTCKSAGTSVSVNVTAIPSVASAVSASPSSICAGASSTLSGTCSVGTLTWYSDASLTTALASNVVSPSATTTYYGACVSGTCKSAGTSVSVNVTAIPSVASSVSASPSSICAGGSSSLSGSCSVGTLSWYSDAGLTTVLSSNVVSPSATTTYYGACVSGTCKSAGTSVSVNVTAIPSVASSVSASPSSICAGGSSSLSGSCSVGTLSWYSDAGLTTVLSSNVVSPSATTTYYGACVSGTCKSAGTSVSVNVTAIPSVASSVSASPSSICAGGSSSLSGSCSVGTLSWYSDAGLTTVLSSNVVSPSSTTTYYGACVSGTCKSAGSSVSINVTAIPSAVVPTTTSKSNVCPATTVDLTSLQPASVSGITYEWHTVSSNPSAIDLVSSPATASAGTYYLYGKTASGCYSVSSSAVTATVNGCVPCSPVDPGTATASATSIKTGNTATFSLTGASAGATTTWAIYPSNGVSPNTGTGTNTGTVSFSVAGEYQVLFTSSNSTQPSGCSEPNTANASVLFLVESPINPCAKPSVSSVTVSPSSASIATGSTASFSLSGGTPNSSVQWVISPSTGVSPSSGTGNSTGNITFASKGLYTVVFSIVNNGDGTCSPVQQSSSATLSVGTTPCTPPSALVISSSVSNQTSNVGQSVTFTATGGTPGNLTWSVSPATGVSPSSGTGNVAMVNFTGIGSYSVTFTSKNSTIPSGCSQPVNSSSTVMHTVVNQKPLATDDISVTPYGKDVSGNVLTNDNDPEGGLLVVTPTPVSPPSKGTVVINSDGTYTYTPDAGKSGTDVFCYKVCDTGGLCDTACVTVNILPKVTPDPLANDKPIANDDNTQTTSGVGVIINSKANDLDPDGNASLGTPTKLTNPSHGVVTQNFDGTFKYTPSPGYVGKDSFTYQICDNGVPSLCDTATVNVEVLATPASGNHPPVAIDDANLTVMNTSVSGSVSANDSDPDAGQVLSYTAIGTPVLGLSINPLDGSYTYSPTSGFVGTVVQKYKVCDNGTPSLCDTATLVIAVTKPANNAPVVIGNPIVTEQDKAATQCMAIADPDAADTHTYTSCGVPAHGTVTASVNNTTHQLCLTYTPVGGYSGTDEFCVLVCDGNGGCDTLKVPVIIVKPVTPTPTPNPPVVLPTDLNTPKGVPVSSCLAIVDANVGDTHTYSLCGAATNGTATASVNNTTHELCITYTPNPGYVGLDEFCVSVCDQTGLCSQVKIPVNVTDSKVPSSPQPPVVVIPPVITDPNTPVTVCGSINDPNVGDTHTASLCNTPSGGNATLSVNNATHQLCVTYTPNAGFTGVDKICVSVCDQTGLCTQKIIPVLVNPTIISIPVANPDYSSATVGQSTVISILSNDKNADGSAVVDLTKITAPNVPTTGLGSPSKGSVKVNPDGTITYTPNAGASGVDTFVYTICNKTQPSSCDTAKVTVNLLVVNQAPLATDDIIVTPYGKPVSGNVLTNDKDPEGGVLVVTPTAVTSPSKGKVVLNTDGTYTYTPDPGKSGSDVFCYKVCDTGGLCDTACVMVNILPEPSPNPFANRKPIANDDNTQTTVGVSVKINEKANDLDPDGNSTLGTPTKLTNPLHGIVTQNLIDGTFSYQPAPGYTGKDSFTYQICDNGVPSLCDTATVNIEVLGMPPVGNQAPVAIDDANITSVNTSIIGSVSANDSDPDAGQTLSYTAIGTPVSGLKINPLDGSYTYSPTSGFEGTIVQKYKVCDNGTPSLCDTASLVITVINNCPSLLAPSNASASTSTVCAGSSVTLGGSCSVGTLTWYSDATLSTAVSNIVTPSVTTTYYGSCVSGTCKSSSVSVSVTVSGSCGVCLLPKVYLQGSLYGVLLPDTLMRDDLRVKGFLPSSSPYSQGLSAVGTVSSATLAVTGNNAIVDWVFVELRKGTDSTQVVDSRSALLQRDGDIVDVDGLSSVKFTRATAGSYYVVVKHRNHLGVMSKKVILDANCKSLDFRKASTVTYTLSTSSIDISQVDVQQGKALWAGNCQYDNSVIYQGTQNDVNVIYQQVISSPSNFFVIPTYKLQGYYTGDVNMNGEVIFQGTNNDVEYIYQNVIKNHSGNAVFKSNYFIIKEQLP